MTDRNNSVDDIIELTDIVEEGSATAAFEDFSMEKAVDAKSLDDELDALLNDTSLDPQGSGGSDDVLDFESLFKEQSSPEPPAPKAKPAVEEPVLGADLSELDDLFDSLQSSAAGDTHNALDAMLAGDNAEDLPELPLMEEPAPKSLAVDLEDDFAALDLDIPELAETLSPEPEAAPLLQEVKQPPQPSADELLAALDSIASVDPLGDAKPVTASPAESMLTEAIFDEPAMSGTRAELESLSARLDALETGKVQPQITPQQILAALPEAPDQLPFMAALKAEFALEQSNAEAAQSVMLQGMQNRIDALETSLASASMGDGNRIESLETEIQTLKDQIAALDARPAQTEITTEDLLTALPADPELLPFMAALRSGLQEEAREATAQILDATATLQGRVTELENRPAPAQTDTGQLQELDTEMGLLRKLLQHQEAAVLTLRESLSEKDALILAQKDELATLSAQLEDLKVAASSGAVEVQTFINQLEATQTTVAELQKLITGQNQTIAELQSCIARQEEALAGSTETASRLAALQDVLDRQEQQLASLATKAEQGPDLEALKAELAAQVLQQVPAAAAAVIREEIAAMLQEMGE